MLTMFSTYYFNLNSHNNNHIFIMFLMIILQFLIYIYYVPYYILFKNKHICVLYIICIVFVHHR